MKVIRAGSVEAKPVTEEGARDVTVRWLIARPEGAPNFAMRLFELAPGGSTPLHEHAWEHEVFVLQGRGEVVAAGGPVDVDAEDAVLVSPGERHQFRNTGEGTMRMLCMIPLSD
jgi:quercetin dioxygenase-like cupin family protein